VKPPFPGPPFAAAAAQALAGQARRCRREIDGDPANRELAAGAGSGSAIGRDWAKEHQIDRAAIAAGAASPPDAGAHINRGVIGSTAPAFSGQQQDCWRTKVGRNHLRARYPVQSDGAPSAASAAGAARATIGSEPAAAASAAVRRDLQSSCRGAAVDHPERAKPDGQGAASPADPAIAAIGAGKREAAVLSLTTHAAGAAVGGYIDESAAAAADCTIENAGLGATTTALPARVTMVRPIGAFLTRRARQVYDRRCWQRLEILCRKVIRQ
jgi:hypothetical protein